MSITRFQRLKHERRFGTVSVDIEIMAQHLITPTFGVSVIGLPPDAEYVTAFYEPAKHGLTLMYAHETFDQVPEGVEAPRLDCQIHSLSCQTHPRGGSMSKDAYLYVYPRKPHIRCVEVKKGSKKPPLLPGKGLRLWRKK